MQCDDLRKPLGAIEIQGLFSAQQVHGAQEAHKTEVVVAMQVADENVIDPLCANAKAFELKLSAFSAVYQVKAALHIYQLRSLISPVGGSRWIRA